MLFPKKVIDNRKKNTKRKISQEVAEEVKARDKCCILCNHPYIEQIHHVYFWLDSNYWPNRNDPDQLVWLCTYCHDKLHSRWGNSYRELCITYLKNIYGNPPKTPNAPID